MTRFLIDIQTELAPAISVEGELDLAAGAAFREEVGKLLAKPRELVIVDLRALTFMDSSGLIELIELDKQAREEGFTLAILRPPPPVARLFELTGLDQHLPLYDPDEPLDHVARRG